jgi:hypothetical protein
MTQRYKQPPSRNRKAARDKQPIPTPNCKS